MTYVAAQDTSDGIAKVIYQSKDAKTSKTFDALDWLAQLATHINSVSRIATQCVVRSGCILNLKNERLNPGHCS